MKPCFTVQLCMRPLLWLCLLLTPTLGGCGLFSWWSEPDMQQGSTETIVKTAYSQIGKTYKSGGASPRSGFDCSGLVYWVYTKNGYALPRISTAQAKAGKAVSKKSIREGDIVVFKVSESPRGLHTGIYTGQGRFIHSPSSGKKVKVDSMKNVYWKNKLIAVRRILL